MANPNRRPPLLPLHTQSGTGGREVVPGGTINVIVYDVVTRSSPDPSAPRSPTPSLVGVRVAEVVRTPPSETRVEYRVPTLRIRGEVDDGVSSLLNRQVGVSGFRTDPPSESRSPRGLHSVRPSPGTPTQKRSLRRRSPLSRSDLTSVGRRVSSWSGRGSGSYQPFLLLWWGL